MNLDVIGKFVNAKSSFVGSRNFKESASSFSMILDCVKDMQSDDLRVVSEGIQKEFALISQSVMSVNLDVNSERVVADFCRMSAIMNVLENHQGKLSQPMDR